MRSIGVICPTRGRPAAAREVKAAYEGTSELLHTELFFVVDQDDETLPEYKRMENSRVHVMSPTHAGGMGNALNAASRILVDHYDILGFIGDDHRFRTKQWDLDFSVHSEDHGPFMGYGNDLFQGQNLPTQIFISSEIVKKLDYFSPPDLRHLYIDNAWSDLGESAGCLYYFPRIIIEHLHPLAGKQEWDEGYLRVNSVESYNADRARYMAWREDGRFRADVEKIKSALATV